MSWLKSLGSGLWIGVLAFLAAMAAMAARREENKATELRERSIAEREGEVVDGVRRAETHMTQVKLHEAKAKQHKERAQARLDKAGENREEVADVLDRWRKSGRLRDGNA